MNLQFLIKTIHKSIIYTLSIMNKSMANFAMTFLIGIGMLAFQPIKIKFAFNRYLGYCPFKTKGMSVLLEN